jgi:hypothetical protein
MGHHFVASSKLVHLGAWSSMQVDVSRFGVCPISCWYDRDLFFCEPRSNMMKPCNHM